MERKDNQSILLIRTIAVEENLSENTYNNQGIGLATELSKLGHRCGLVYYAKEGRGRLEKYVSEGQELTIYHIEGINLAWNAIYNNQLYEICRQYDVLQVSECDQICSWQVYKKFPQKTIIYHGPYQSKFTVKYNLRSKVYDVIFLHRKGYSTVPVITKSRLAEYYLRKKGFSNIRTLGVGLNSKILLQQEGLPAHIQKVIAEKKDHKFLLYVGAISKRKNFEFLVKLMARIAARCRDVHLLVVGTPAYKEKKYFNCMQAKIKTLQLENHIYFLGTVSQHCLKAVYEASDIFLIPTQYDIFGMVYLEAMYFGLPIVTTLCGGSSLLIQEGETGYIRETKKIEEWVEAVETLISQEDLRRLMGRKGRQLIEDHYLWNNLALEFEKEYEKLK